MLTQYVLGSHGDGEGTSRVAAYRGRQTSRLWILPFGAVVRSSPSLRIEREEDEGRMSRVKAKSGLHIYGNY